MESDGGSRDGDRGQNNDGRMAEREEQADRNRALAFLHQLARDVVDGGDMVGIDGMAQAETIGQQRRAQQQRKRPKSDESPGPGTKIGRDQQAVDADHLAADVGGVFAEDISQNRIHAGLPLTSSVAANQTDPALDRSHRDTPPDANALTPVDGRSPGSRVSADHRLPGFPVASWRSARRLQLRGQPRSWHRASPVFPFDPRREPSVTGWTVRNRPVNGQIDTLDDRPPIREGDRGKFRYLRLRVIGYKQG